MKKPEISIVIPIYNEEQNIPELYRRLNATLAHEIHLTSNHGAGASFTGQARNENIEGKKGENDQ